MNIEDAIFINKLAQGIIDIAEGEKWFLNFPEEGKRTILYKINSMILQAHPIPSDVNSAIVATGLKQTLTPFVLISKPKLNHQLAKIANLPERELPVVFRLLIRLLGISDERRREAKPLDLKNHWWHRDLRNPEIVAEICNQFGG